MSYQLKNIILLFGLSLFLAACDFKKELPEFTQILVYPKKNDLPQFELQQHSGDTFSAESFKGKWNLLFMGYTNCPDVCPLTLTEMTKIYESIPQELQKKFQVIFLSVDPKRDTISHMAKYIDHFNDDFLAVTGDKDEIDKIVYGLGGIYSINSESEEYYSVDHTGRIFIVSPQAQRFGIVSSEAMHNKDKSKLIAELTELAPF